MQENLLCFYHDKNINSNRDVGQFPNRGNPHEIKAQNYQFTTPSKPVKNANITVRKNRKHHHAKTTTNRGYPRRILPTY